MEILLRERQHKSFFPLKIASSEQIFSPLVAAFGHVPFCALHCVHSNLHVIIIAVDLFLKIFLSLGQMRQCCVHILYRLLTLHPLPMLATHVHGDGVQDPLEPIASGNLSLFL
jgi:hypothetical protein